ncbi:MAG TPA: hypothetical protein VHZ03_25435 [Trebonia sp.]|nr:hypothetical protein [Trebonia sp.]
MTTRPKRTSIRATYDSRETGPRYHVTTRIDSRTLVFQHPADDPFVRQTVTIGWRDLLRGLMRRCLTVTVIVGGDHGITEDVSELDDNYLGANCTRWDAWNSHINESLGRIGA